MRREPAVRHAMAMVRWEVFRSGELHGRALWGGGQRIFDYACPKPRLTEIVGGGGTLWLVTSRRRANQPRRYHLAYKLVGCSTVPAEASPSELFGKYAVRGDMGRSVHFTFNDVTDTLRRLVFTSGKPMSQASNLGLRLLSIPELTMADIDLMERFEHKLRNSCSLFISYSHRDRPYVERLETELERYDVHASRDDVILHAGDEFEEALRREARNADCFLILVSPNAAASDWVRREIKWAVEEYKAGGFVKRVTPLVLPGGGWETFQELHCFHRRDWPTKPDEKFFRTIAADVSS